MMCYRSRYPGSAVCAEQEKILLISTWIGAYASARNLFATNVFLLATNRRQCEIGELSGRFLMSFAVLSMPASVFSAQDDSGEVLCRIPGIVLVFQAPEVRFRKSRSHNDAPMPAADHDQSLVPSSLPSSFVGPKNAVPGRYPRHRCAAVSLLVSILRCCRSHNEELRWLLLQSIFRCCVRALSPVALFRGRVQSPPLGCSPPRGGRRAPNPPVQVPSRLSSLRGSGGHRHSCRPGA